MQNKVMVCIRFCNLMHVWFSKSNDFKDKMEFSTAVECAVFKKIEGTVPCSSDTVA